MGICTRKPPEPDDYSGSDILNYPFVKNEKGHIWIGSKQEEEAFARWQKEKIRQINDWDEIEKGMKILSQSIDNLIEERNSQFADNGSSVWATREEMANMGITFGGSDLSEDPQETTLINPKIFKKDINFRLN